MESREALGVMQKQYSVMRVKCSLEEKSKALLISELLKIQTSRK